MTVIPLQPLLAAAVLVVVLALIVTRPRGLSVAWPAGIGAIVLLLLGVLSLSQVLGLFGDVWDACLTLIALFMLSEALDSNGFFTWSALTLARKARGSGWRLYLLVLLLTTGVSALLANDGAVLMLTPIFARLMLRIYQQKRESWLPIIFAAGFFADAMSAIFIPSNLTNIIIADVTHLSFLPFTLTLLFPMCVAFIVASAAFALRFRRSVGMPYDYEELEVPATAIRNRRVFWWSWGVLAFLLGGYIIAGEKHLPVSLAACAAALILLVVVKASNLSGIAPLIYRAPWDILIYALGMFIVISAAYHAGILGFITHPWMQAVGLRNGLLSTVSSGAFAAVLSAAVNNLPATLVGVLVIRATEHVNTLATYAIVLGVDIGPKLTPFGSLATLLWLGSLKRNGIHIGWGEFVRENAWVAALTLAASLGALALVGAIFHL